MEGVKITLFYGLQLSMLILRVVPRALLNSEISAITQIQTLENHKDGKQIY